MTKLNNTSLHTLSPAVRIPAYDRTGLLKHTVHLGVGSFHRAHQAVYLDDLLALPDTDRWGECGIGVLKSDNRMRDALLSQNGLYTLIERSAATQSARVIGSLVDFLYAPDQRETAIERMASPETRIVSLTITEGGYYIDDNTGAFLSHHRDIQHDLEHPNSPASSMGLIAAALVRRRARGLAPFTVMSCDNLHGNGHITKRVLLAFAGLSNPALQQWIERNVAFPNSMVDRITPATTPADIAFVSEHFGIDDAWPVVTEPFRQWVVEDTFSNGRPQWQRVGVELISDVLPYEVMKMRLLNGGHLAMAYLGALAGFTYVHDILADPLFVEFIQAFMEEVTPVVPVIPGTSVAEYKRTLMERFSNPTINDQVTRICSEGSAKIPKWLVPSITELLDRGGQTKVLALIVASWIFYLGVDLDERGQRLEKIDAHATGLVALARSSCASADALLAVTSIFGERLASDSSFTPAVTDALRSLQHSGVRATLHQFLAKKTSDASC